MHRKRLRRVVLFSLPLAALAAVSLYANRDRLSPAEPAAATAKPLAASPVASVDVPAAAAEPLPEGLSQSELRELLDSPRVRTYFQREREKQALADYFGGGDSALSDEQVWDLINRIESDGRMLAYEALALKLEWLERNSVDKAEFDAAAGDLVVEYQRRAEESQHHYDPYRDVPGFADYKAAERRIVAEVQQMSVFPDGMSRQEYLRKRLQEARQQAMP